jgi:hypothetical protein
MGTDLPAGGNLAAWHAAFRPLLAAAVLAILSTGVAAAGAERAEVQINLCLPPDEIVQRLGLTGADIASADAWYFDTARLDLAGRGLLLRLRVAAGAADFTLKVRGLDCSRLDPELVPEGAGKCEYDLHGESPDGAVSLTAGLDRAVLDALLAGRVPVASVLSPAQRRMLDEGVHAWPLPGNLLLLGPARIRALRGRDRAFVVELWELPSGREFVEISRKVSLDAAWGTRDRMLRVLEEAGVRTCADQSSQARAKLEDLLPR